jgi:hypothetical protein
VSDLLTVPLPKTYLTQIVVYANSWMATLNARNSQKAASGSSGTEVLSYAVSAFGAASNPGDSVVGISTDIESDNSPREVRDARFECESRYILKADDGRRYRNKDKWLRFEPNLKKVCKAK